MALNDEQLAAMSHRGNAMVIAGAGAGKTTTIIDRIKWVSGFSGPNEVLAMTFSRKAAGEMRDRLGSSAHGIANVTTYHAWCSLFLKEMADRDIDIDGRSRNFTTADEVVQQRIIKQAMKEDIFKTLSGSSEINVRSLLEKIGTQKESSITGELHMGNPAEQFLADRYNQELLNNNMVDFADMLRITLSIMNMGDKYIPKYKHLIIDEAQDTNTIQFEILKKLARIDGQKTKAAIFLVGDMDQCIYEWRGAKPTNVMNAEDVFGCKVFKLETNYRSTPNIVKSANAVIQRNSNRIEKVMHPVRDGGSPIGYFDVRDHYDEANRIAIACEKTLAKDDDTTIGILYRANLQAREIERVLWSRNIPYVIKNNTGFMKRKEVMNTMSLLSAIVNDRDVQNRIMVASRSIDRMGEAIAEKCMRAIYGALGSTPERPKGVGQEKFDEVVELYEKIERLGSMRTKEAVSYINMPGNGLYNGLVSVSGDDDEKQKAREDNVRHLLDTLAGYNSITEFVDDKVLDADAGEEPEPARINLMTIHASKGLEFDQVFMPGCTDSMFVGKHKEEDWQFEEARRLFYVGLTRAKNRVIISTPARMSIPNMDCEPCRFIHDIPDECINQKPNTFTGKRFLEKPEPSSNMDWV